MTPNNPFVQLKYWKPERIAANRKRNYGHVSLLIRNSFIPEKYRDQLNGRDFYISYIKGPRDGSAGFQIVNNYQEDRDQVMGRDNDDFVNFYELDIGKLLDAHFKYINEHSRDGVYSRGSLLTLFDRGAVDIAGGSSGLSTETLGISNCAEYAYHLLQVSGLKKAKQFTTDIMRHFGFASVGGTVWIVLGNKYDNKNVMIAGGIAYLYASIMFFIAICACCARTAKGQGAGISPEGLFELAKQYNQPTKDCSQIPFSFFDCTGSPRTAAGFSVIMYNIFCVASLTEVVGLQYASLGLGIALFLLAIGLQCGKIFSSSVSHLDEEQGSLPTVYVNEERETISLLTNRHK